MGRRAILGLLIGLAALAPAGHAEAAPMSSDFVLIRAEATTVVIGKMIPGPDLVIDVDTVIRGNAKLGRRKLATSPDGTSEATGRVVAFIDKSNAFRWVGVLAAGSTIESGVLRLSGFYDWNAHLVTPSVMTLAQLQGLLGGTPIKYRFSATINVADTTGGYVSSGTVFTFEHDPTARKTTLGSPIGACLGDPWLMGLEWGSLTIGLSDTCPPPTTTPGAHRELELEGHITGVDVNGVMSCALTPRKPFLDAKDFPTFIADPTIATVKRLVDVKLTDGSIWTWDLGNRLIAPDGTVHEAGGLSSQSFSQNGVTTYRGTYDFRGPSITFEPKIGYGMSTGGNASAVIEMIDGNMYTSCYLSEKGRADRDCVLSRGRAKIVRR